MTEGAESSRPGAPAVPGTGRSGRGPVDALLDALLDVLDFAACVFERLPPRMDGLRDYRYVAVNEAMRVMFGVDDLVGRSIRETFPDEAEAWCDDYDRVLETGEPVRVVRRSDPQRVTLEMSVTRVDDGTGLRLLAVLQEVTARESGQRNRAFLLALHEASRPLTDAASLQAAAARVLGEHLDAGRVHYAEVVDGGRTAVVWRDYVVRGLSSVAGRHRLTDFTMTSADLHSGRTFVVDDCAGDGRLSGAERDSFAALGVGAIVVVPLVKQGALVALLAVHAATARSWTADDVTLVEETAERTWAEVERARAEERLRDREEQLRLALEAAGAGTWSLTPQTGQFEASPRAVEIHGLPPDTGLTHEIALSCVHPDDRARVEAALERTVETGAPLRLEHRVVHADAPERWVSSLAERRTHRGLPRVIGLVQDVTVRRRAEDALRAREAEEHDLVLQLQRALLPARLPSHPYVQLGACYEAGGRRLEVGGDWYDAHVLDDGRIALSVGDVVGTGLDAAVAMGRLRTAITAVAFGRSPAQVLTELDAFVSRTQVTDFATVVHAVYDPATGLLDYAYAGHPPLIAVSPDGTVRRLDGGRTPPLLGGLPMPRTHVPRTQVRAVVEPGTLLLAYSDGLVERRGESLDVGLARLDAAAAGVVAHDAADACSDILAAVGVTGSRTDDVVVLAARLAVADQQLLRAVFPARAENAGLVVAAVSAWAQRHTGATDTALIVAVQDAWRDVTAGAQTGGAPGLVCLTARIGTGGALDVRLAADHLEDQRLEEDDDAPRPVAAPARAVQFRHTPGCGA